MKALKETVGELLPYEEGVQTMTQSPEATEKLRN